MNHIYLVKQVYYFDKSISVAVIISYQHKLIKMRARLANLNHCAYLSYVAPPPTCVGATIIQILYSNTVGPLLSAELDYLRFLRPKFGNAQLI